MKKLILLTGMLLMMTAKSVFASPLSPKIAPSDRMTVSEITETVNKPATSTLVANAEPIDPMPATSDSVAKIEPIARMSTSEIRATINQPTTYIFEGVKGRELTLSLWAGQLTAELYSPNGENLGVIEKSDNQWIGQLPDSGIYRLRVTPKGETSSFVIGRDFNAKWIYRPDRSVPIAFGEKEATVKLKMSGYQIQALTVPGQQGQTIRVTASKKNLDVAIESPSGQLLDQGEGQTFAQLPESGTYKVLIVANRPVKPSIKVSVR
ncbi:hypothetical protein IQ270_19050 [Microcoleus sp. LEGE 07076]|uniref:hypothetical protein n=1 Tax=Microcoleus sp. LEGE 07076 TaxID=915322 RepID=UPI00188020AF|nr:hypothetical protein [Microcoleus sp. LEGE 07076]MBE9186724.1 hypothetical protein [Microcoleus sp. LEGE 07076]